jgi:hypothetical protein
MAKKAKQLPLTNAEFAFAISHVLRIATIATVTMAEGMDKPEFCSAPAAMYALSIIDDMEHQIDNIKKRLPSG